MNYLDGRNVEVVVVRLIGLLLSFLPFLVDFFRSKKNDDDLCYHDGTNTVDSEDKDLPRPHSSMSCRYLRMTVSVVCKWYDGAEERKKLYKCTLPSEGERPSEKEKKKKRERINRHYRPIRHLYLVLVFRLVESEPEEKTIVRSIILLVCTSVRERSNRNEATAMSLCALCVCVCEGEKAITGKSEGASGKRANWTREIDKDKCRVWSRSRCMCTQSIDRCARACVRAWRQNGDVPLGRHARAQSRTKKMCWEVEGE